MELRRSFLERLVFDSAWSFALEEPKWSALDLEENQSGSLKIELKALNKQKATIFRFKMRIFY